MSPFFGQSNLDLSIQLTGNLDSLVKLCNESNVSNISVNSLNYTESLSVLNPSNIGHRYATQNKAIISTGDYDLSDYSSEDYL